MLIMSKFAYMFICLYTNNISVKKIEIIHIYMVIRVYGFLLLF